MRVYFVYAYNPLAGRDTAVASYTDREQAEKVRQDYQEFNARIVPSEETQP